MTRLDRRLLLLALTVLGLLAAAGHAWFWYLPRERPRTPDGADLPARLLMSEAYDHALWIPHPHQNLQEMADAVGDPEGWLAAAARVADVPPPVFRRFGPFSVPPAREITVAADEGGERAMAVARIYPLIAWVARLAGKLAGNPWLGGGTVRLDDGTAQVAWDGTLWTVRKGPEPTLPSEVYPPYEPLLGAVASTRPHELFPAGLYALRRTAAGGFELRSGSIGNLDVDTAQLAGSGVLVALIDGPGLPLGEPPSALLVFDRETERMIDLPAAAVLYREVDSPQRSEDPGRQPAQEEDAAREAERIRDAFLNGDPGSGVVGDEGRSEDRPGGRLRMPQERLPELLRGTLREGEAAGLRIVASDRPALQTAVELAPGVASLLDRQEAGAMLWIAPRPLLALLERAVEMLDKIPLISSSDVQEWRDWRTVLLPLDRYERISVVRTVDPEGFRLVLTAP